MKRFFPRDALLMLAPVAMLGVFGWLLSARKPAQVTIGPKGPFKPFVSHVRVLPARPVDVFDGYDTRVLVEFDAKGQLPKWWEQGFTSYYSTKSGQLVRSRGGKTASVGKPDYMELPHLDPQSKRWISIYNLKLRDIPANAGQIHLRDTVTFQNNSQQTMMKLWLDAPLRAMGEVTKLPRVPRQPAVKVEALSFEPAPPIQSHDGQKRWRARWTILKNIPVSDANAAGVSASLVIVNRKGDAVGRWYRMQGFGEYDDSALFSPSANNKNPRRGYGHQDYSLDTEVSDSEPLWLQGSIRCEDKWPLAIKTPIRDAQGNMLFTPRTVSVPFRVVSVTKVAPDSSEVASDGADCTVKVVVKGWAPSADVTTWKWETDYSQHVRSASGGEFWELPFKGGKSVIGVSSGWDSNKSRMELRYPLVLKSIPASKGRLVFHADIAANRSRRVPVEVIVRP